MISTAIIHTPGRPERSSLVANVLDVLPSALVVLDTDGSGDHRIANRRGCWPLARRAWSLPCAEHHLVLEDDAVLCDDFSARLAGVVATRPDAVISLFYGDRWCSVATVMPRSIIGPWLAWSEQESRIRPHHDQMIILGCQALGVEHLWCSPSLVDQADVPSLLGHPPVHAHSIVARGDNVAFVQATWLPYFATRPPVLRAPDV